MSNPWEDFAPQQETSTPDTSAVDTATSNPWDEFAQEEQPAPSQGLASIPGRIASDIKDFVTGETGSAVTEGVRRLFQPTELGLALLTRGKMSSPAAQSLVQNYQESFPQIPLETGTGKFVADLIGTAPISAVGGAAVTGTLGKLATIPKVGPIVAPLVASTVVAPTIGVVQAAKTAEQLGKEFTLDDAKQVYKFGAALGLGATTLVGLSKGVRGIYAKQATKVAKASEEAYAKQPTLSTTINPVVGESTLIDQTNAQIKNLKSRQANISEILATNAQKNITKEQELARLDSEIANLTTKYQADTEALSAIKAEVDLPTVTTEPGLATIADVAPGAGRIIRKPGDLRVTPATQKKAKQTFITKMDQQTAVAEKKAQELATIRQQKAQSLQNEYELQLKQKTVARQKLTDSLETLPQSKVEAFVDEISNLDDQVSALETQIEGLTIKYKTIPKVVTSLTNSAQQATALATKTVQNLQNFVKLGVITEEQFQKMAPGVAQEVAKLQGVIPKSQWLFEAQSIRSFIDPISTFNRMQQRTGTKAGSITEEIVTVKPQSQNYRAEKLASVADPIAKLNKMGIPDDQITQRLQYVESLPDGTMQFNPTAVDIKGTKIPAWNPDVPPPSQEELTELFKLRKFFDDIAQEENVLKRGRYIPIRLKLEKSNYSGLSARNVANPTFEQARLSGELVPGVTETNIKTVLNRYVADVARSKYMKPALEKANTEIATLRLLGYQSEANLFEDSLIYAFSLKDADALRRAFAANVFKEHESLLKAAIKAGGINEEDAIENAWTQLWDKFQESAAVNLAGINPRVWMLQAVQPESTLSALVGFTNVARARLKILKPTAEEANRYGRLVKFSNAEGLDAIEGFSNANATASIPKLVDTLNKPAKFVASQVMGKTESYNRKLGIIAADIVFDDAWAKGGTAALEGRAFANLNGSQRELVREAFRTGGKEAAKDAFAVITTNRANMMYNVANKPKALQVQYLRRVLFTTYMRGIQSQVFDAVSEGRVGSLADLLVQPLLLNSILASFTGGTVISGMQPLSSLAGIKQLDLTPATLIGLKQKDLKGLANVLPVAGVVRQIQRAPEKQYTQKAKDPFDFLIKSFK
jgi:hypothetical protein